MTAVESRCAIIELVADLFPPEEQERWLLTPHSALNGDWPSMVSRKGNEEAVYRLLLRIKWGNEPTPHVTPAMQARIADHVWSVEEIAGLLDYQRKANQLKCPKCNEGEMKLEVRATTPLTPDYAKAKLVCQQCGHKANPRDVMPPKKSN